MELNFQKGNANEPAGAAYFYTELQDEDSLAGEAKPTVSFGTYDRMFFLKKTKDFPISQKTLRFIFEMARASEHILGVTWYGTIIPELRAVSELTGGIEDIIFCGRWTDEDVAQSVTRHDMQQYTQLTAGRLRGGLLPSTLLEDSYKEFEGHHERFKDYLNLQYVNPMVYAILQGDRDKYRTLRSLFISFFNGAPFLHDAIQICDEIEKLRISRPDLQVINLLVEKMTAIMEDNPLRAAVIKRRLEEIAQISS